MKQQLVEMFDVRGMKIKVKNEIGRPYFTLSTAQNFLTCLIHFILSVKSLQSATPQIILSKLNAINVKTPKQTPSGLVSVWAHK